MLPKPFSTSIQQSNIPMITHEADDEDLSDDLDREITNQTE